METVHILIADDQPRVRDSLRALLETADGLEVVGEARDGQDAVEQAERLAPDIVLMDLEMPRLDGLAATAALTRHTPSPAVILLTIYNWPWVEAAARQVGAAAFIGKTAQPETIVQTIRALAARN